jgi:SAM-dependent methyltransferase
LCALTTVAILSAMTIPLASEDEISGLNLYGDNFSLDQIQEWYDSEVTGYFDLLSHHYKITDADNKYNYEYDALNRFHAIGSLLKRQFDTCLALGCAAGDDIAPLAPVVQRFIAIEPAEKWWRDDIGGKPAIYMRPSAIGDIELDSATVDIATSFGVLHHIPNVSHVVGEIARVLKPGGLFVLREPISSMGDWRKARAGLTANERGLPVGWFESLARARGFKVLARRACMFGPLPMITKKLGLATPFARMPIVKLDWLISEAFRWNARYWRDSFPKKLAPSSAFWILERPG